MQEFAMAHPWLTFFAAVSALGTVRILFRGWPDTSKTADAIRSLRRY